VSEGDEPGEGSGSEGAESTTALSTSDSTEDDSLGESTTESTEAEAGTQEQDPPIPDLLQKDEEGVLPSRVANADMDVVLNCRFKTTKGEGGTYQLNIGEIAYADRPKAGIKFPCKATPEGYVVPNIVHNDGFVECQGFGLPVDNVAKLREIVEGNGWTEVKG